MSEDETQAFEDHPDHFHLVQLRGFDEGAKALGAKPNPIAVPNVPESLANGVVSGYDNTLLYAFATQWYKEIKYVTMSSHIYQAAAVVWCKKWFDKLPSDRRTAK